MVVVFRPDLSKKGAVEVFDLFAILEGMPRIAGRQPSRRMLGGANRLKIIDIERGKIAMHHLPHFTDSGGVR